MVRKISEKEQSIGEFDEGLDDQDHVLCLLSKYRDIRQDLQSARVRGYRIIEDV